MPKEEVIQYLEVVNPELVLTYLDHCIFKSDETSTKFIDTLINKYRESIRPWIIDYRMDMQRKYDTIEVLDISQNSENDLLEKTDLVVSRPEPAGQEPGKLGELRRKLMNLLEVCDYYTTETLSAYLLHDGLFEERAIVLGKMGNYREALMIYVHILNDLELAEQYCLKQYEKTNSIHKDSNRDVFLYLFEQCLFKPDKDELSKYFIDNDNNAISTYKLPLLLPKSVISYLKNEQNKRNLDDLDLNVQIAIAILAQHSTKINLFRAIELLEDKLPLRALDLILSPSIHHLGSKNNHTRFLRRLLKSEWLKVHEERIQVEQSNSVVITGTEICKACMKKIGKRYCF